MGGKRIIVAGHMSLDITPAISNSECQDISKLLKPGKLLQVGEAKISAGGAVSNTGFALNKLGENVTLISKIGNDVFGNILEKIIEESGCNTRLIKSDNEVTSYTIVITSEGSDRIFLHDPGCNHTFSYYDIDWDLVEKSDYFHFGYPTIMRNFYKNDGEELVQLYKKVKEKNLVASLDLSSVDPNSEAGKCNWEAILKRVLPYVDFFVPSIEELGFMLDRKRYDIWQKKAGQDDIISVLSLENDIKPLAQKALSYGCKSILLKCGKAGMYLKTSAEEVMTQIDTDLKGWGNIEIFENSYVPDKIVSATGAGDTSIAAFLKCVMRGKSPEESIRYATATGACCVTTYDTISGLKTLEQLQEKIENGWAKQYIVNN